MNGNEFFQFLKEMKKVDTIEMVEIPGGFKFINKDKVLTYEFYKKSRKVNKEIEKRFSLLSGLTSKGLEINEEFLKEIRSSDVPTILFKDTSFELKNLNKRIPIK